MDFMFKFATRWSPVAILFIYFSKSKLKAANTCFIFELNRYGGLKLYY